jgi:putative tryptophan/tyrosine transport system substrate-binding protein
MGEPHHEPFQLSFNSSLRVNVPGSRVTSDGGLLSLEPDESEQLRIYAFFIDKIRRGAHPADLPIQQPSACVLSLNMKAAKALGLTIPRALVQRADKGSE